MVKLQVRVQDSLYLSLKASAKSLDIGLSTLISNLLEEKHGKTMLVSTPPRDIEVVDKRNPEVQEVIGHWESTMGIKMGRQLYQRRAAKTLIQRYEIKRVLAAIQAVDRCRGDRFAPNIPDLCALRDRWLELENYYRKQSGRIEIA